MIITDSGLHVWQAPTPERPWNPAKAHLKDPMSYEDLRARMKEAGVDRAILVPPSFAGAYPEYSLEAAAKYPEQFAVMGSVPLNKPDGPPGSGASYEPTGRTGRAADLPSRI